MLMKMMIDTDGSNAGDSDFIFINESSGSGELDNMSVICAAKEFKLPPLQPDIVQLFSAFRYINILYFATLLLAGVILNSMVLIIVFKYKTLQLSSFAIALQVIVSDLILTSLIFPTRLISAIADKWLLGDTMCVFAGFINNICYFTRCLLMFTLTVDGFSRVFMPLKYPKHRRKVIAILSVLSWTTAVLLSATQLPGLSDCYSFNPYSRHCGILARCGQICGTLSRLIAIFIAVPSAVVPLILYAIMYRKAKKLGQGTTPANDLNINIRINTRRDWTADISFFLMFMALFFVTIPTPLALIILQLAKSISPSSAFQWVPGLVTGLTLDIFNLLVVMDPIVIMRNKSIRDILCNHL